MKIRNIEVNANPVYTNIDENKRSFWSDTQHEIGKRPYLGQVLGQKTDTHYETAIHHSFERVEIYTRFVVVIEDTTRTYKENIYERK